MQEIYQNAMEKVFGNGMTAEDREKVGERLWNEGYRVIAGKLRKPLIPKLSNDVDPNSEEAKYNRRTLREYRQRITRLVREHAKVPRAYHVKLQPGEVIY